MARSEKAARDELRARLAAEDRSIAEIAVQMQRAFGDRPRRAWRAALGWPQWKAVQQYRTVNPDAPIDDSRLSRWENWPHGGSRPALEDLARLARAFGHGCRVADLIDAIDREHLPSAQQDLLHQLATPGTTASSGTSENGQVDLTRRAAIGAAAASVISWSGSPRSESSRRYGATDVARVYVTASGFARADQKHGGGSALSDVTDYLMGDVQRMVGGRFANDAVRSAMFSAAAEVAYVAGWMAFDDARQSQARRMLTTSVRLADEAGDPALAGHALRALAHQAIELGKAGDALSLAEASVESDRYRAACPRERALFGVVHARALATAGLGGASAAALVRAENDLSGATLGDEEPGRVFFFTEASLAHETGRTLYASGDLSGAERALTHSVELRGSEFVRTHAVTLGYLGEIQAARGHLDQACSTWSIALDATEGVRSGRVRDMAGIVRQILEPVRGMSEFADLDQRAAAYLATA